MLPRKTIYAMSQDARTDNPGARVYATIVDAKRMKFTARIFYVNKGNTNANYEIATPKGAVKVYGDADSIMKDFAAVLPSVVNGAIEFELAPLIKPTPSNYDADRANAAELARTQRLVLTQQKHVDDLDDELVKIASFATGTPSQQALFAERTAQRATAFASKAAMENRVTELLALV